MKNTNSNVYDGQKVNINKTQGYVCYSHPTKLNEKGHVKQVTRSIKGLDDNQLNALCIELDDLLVKFSEYTKDFTVIEEIKEGFNTKAFGWIIEEALAEESDKIVKSTSEKLMCIDDNSTVYNLLANSSLKKENIPKQINNGKCPYMLVKRTAKDKFLAVVEFKELIDFEEYIIKQLVEIIKNLSSGFDNIFSNMFYDFFDFNIEEDEFTKFINSVEKIKKTYLKEYKIKDKNFVINYSYSNFVANRLKNKDNDLVVLVYENITKIINTNTSNCNDSICYRLNKNDKTPKILFLESDNETDFNNKLGEIFALGDPYKSLENMIKKVYLKGDFSIDMDEDSCILNSTNINLENIIDCITNDKAEIHLDGLITNDYKLYEILEKIIVFGGIVKCKIDFENNLPSNHNYFSLRKNLIEFLSKSGYVNGCIDIYANRFILEKKLYDGEFGSPYYIHPLGKNSKIDFSQLLLDYYSSYNIYENFNELLFDINIVFATKVKNYFTTNNYNYCSKKSITKIVKESLLESLVYSLYKYFFNTNKLVIYKHNNSLNTSFIVRYNIFMKDNLARINSEIKLIVEDKLNKIFESLSDISDYGVYKKCLQDIIIKEVEIQYIYVRKLFDEFIIPIFGDKNNE